MEDVKIILSGLWIATMLVFLWGDVLSLIAGDAEKMFSDQVQMTQAMWIGIAVLMLIPIVMVVVSLTLPHRAAIFWIGFNLLSLGGYPAYEKILLVVSMGFNLLTIWYAWNWV
jgi:hypothetical protein